MVRTKDPAIRALLLERAAQLLRTRQPVTLRGLVTGTGVSTMAVYTYFGGMDGLWRALRQEGFVRLAAGLAAVQPSDDPVQDLAALGAAYLGNALDNPDLYRVMFDADFDLEDPAAADESLHALVHAVERAKADGRFRAETDPAQLATQSWTIGHGLASLVATGPLPRQALGHGVPLLSALFTSAGDTPDRCRRSVERGWSEFVLPQWIISSRGNTPVVNDAEWLAVVLWSAGSRCGAWPTSATPGAGSTWSSR